MRLWLAFFIAALFMLVCNEASTAFEAASVFSADIASMRKKRGHKDDRKTVRHLMIRFVAHRFIVTASRATIRMVVPMPATPPVPAQHTDENDNGP